MCKMDDKRKIYAGSHCAAMNCSNNRRNNPDLSFFKFPLDRYVARFYTPTLHSDCLPPSCALKDFAYRNLGSCENLNVVNGFGLLVCSVAVMANSVICDIRLVLYSDERVE